MKFTKQPEDTGFKPVDVTITFESQEEINTIKKFLWYNTSIPSIAYKNDTPQYYLVQKFMNRLRTELELAN